MRGASSQCCVLPLAILLHGESCVLMVVAERERECVLRCDAVGEANEERVAHDSNVGVALAGRV